jgi:hypothetical protein
MEDIGILISGLNPPLASGGLTCQIHKRRKTIWKLPRSWSVRKWKSDIERLCALGGYGHGRMNKGKTYFYGQIFSITLWAEKNIIKYI